MTRLMWVRRCRECVLLRPGRVYRLLVAWGEANGGRSSLQGVMHSSAGARSYRESVCHDVVHRCGQTCTVQDSL